MVRRRDRRGLTTLLFTDICRSTEIAAELGDRRWRHLQMRHHAAVRKELKRHGGREVDTAGDGFFASFASPAAAIRCAFAIVTGMREIGLDIRAGLHIGEAELSGEKVSGIAVTTAKRVEEMARPAQVLSTDTIVHLVAGSGFDFTDVGSRELKGVPGRWELFSLDAVNGESIGPPLDPPEAIDLRDRASPPQGGAPRRRWIVPVAAVVAVAVLAALSAAFLRLGRHPMTVQPNTLARIDPKDEKVTGSFAVGQQPSLVAADGHSIWAVSFDEGTLWDIDAASGSEQTPKGLGGHPTGLTIGDSELWLTDEFKGTLVRVDPSTRQPETILDHEPGLSDVVFAGGALWVSNMASGTISEVDPETGHAKQPIAVGRRPDGIAEGNGNVWVDSSLDRTVTKIDEATEKSLSFTVDHAPGALAFGMNSLWVADPEDDLVSEIDPETGKVVNVFPVGDGPAAIAVGPDRVWVADGLDGTVAAIDPVAGRVSTVQVGQRPTAITVDPTGNVWVAVTAP